MWALTPSSFGPIRRPSKNPQFDAAADVGPVVLPKLLRRTWAVHRRSKMVTDTFLQFLRSENDQMLLTEDFVEQGPAAVVRTLGEFLHANGLSDLWPEEMVFREAACRLVDANGQAVEAW